MNLLFTASTADLAVEMLKLMLSFSFAAPILLSVEGSLHATKASATTIRSWGLNVDLLVVF
ncbi:hypothetical protein [Flavitalea sp.]|nr:hypothetical protein [Flavitalea sp.]